jgi:hypothetical protein
VTESVRRIDRVLAADYLGDLEERSLDDLRAMKAEAAEVETEVSYVRRLAQGRLDILAAERKRRDAGGSLEDLVNELPKILASEAPRAPAAQARAAELLAPSPDISWTRGREHLIDDSTLARLPDLTDEELTEAVAALRALEEEMSGRRKALHGVLDTLEHTIATNLRQ